MSKRIALALASALTLAAPVAPVAPVTPVAPVAQAANLRIGLQDDPDFLEPEQIDVSSSAAR